MQTDRWDWTCKKCSRNNLTPNKSHLLLQFSGNCFLQLLYVLGCSAATTIAHAIDCLSLNFLESLSSWLSHFRKEATLWQKRLVCVYVAFLCDFQKCASLFICPFGSSAPLSWQKTQIWQILRRTELKKDEGFLVFGHMHSVSICLLYDM